MERDGLGGEEVKQLRAPLDPLIVEKAIFKDFGGVPQRAA